MEETEENSVHVEMSDGKLSKEGQHDAMWGDSAPDHPDPPASNSTPPGAERSLSISVPGASVSFHDIHYTIQVGEQGKCCSKVPKHIIKGVRYEFNNSFD